MIVQLSDVMDERREKVASEVNKLKSQSQPRLEAAITCADNVNAQLSARAREVRSEIRSATQRVIQTAQACEQQLLQEVDDIEEFRLKILDKQKDELKSHLDSVKNAVAFSELLDESKAADDDKLALLVALEDRAKALNKMHTSDTPQQNEKVNSRMCFYAPNEDAVLEKLKVCAGRVSQDEVCAVQCTVNRLLTGPQSFVKKGQTAVFTVKTVKADGQPLVEGGDCVTATCVSSSARKASVIEVEDKQDGQYEIRARPEEEGEYSLEIRVNGERLPHTACFVCGDFVFDSNACHPNISLTNRNQRAELRSKGDVSVLGSIGMRRGVHRWSLQIGSKAIYHVIGVIAKPITGLGDIRTRSQSFKTVYKGGFTLGGARCDAFLDELEGHDTVQLDLDCDAHTLRVTNLRNGNTALITNLPDQEYFPYVHLHNNGNSAQLIQ